MNREIITSLEILSWIEGKIRSSISLLFIDNAIWQPGNERKENHLLQYIDAMANHGGGTIVFGVQTFRGRAQKIVGIDVDEKTPFWLKTLIKTNISPVIDKMDIYIQKVNDKSVLVLSMESNDIPYMIVGDSFYGWNDLKPRKFLEQEIRQLYQNSHKPHLEYVGVMNTQGVGLLENGVPTSIQFYPKFLIRNAGTAPEKDYKTELWFPSSLTDASFNPLQQYFQRLDGIYTVFSVPGKTTLFQDEIYTIAEAKLTIHKENIYDFIKHDFLIQIFFSNGKKTYHFKLSEIFSYQKQKILNETIFNQRVINS